MAMEKILIVDDEPNICEVLRTILVKEGYTAITATDGEEALAKFASVHPDLVLLDVMMPGMNGYTVMREIQKRSNVPVILVTAKSEPNDEALGLDLGAEDYITKPIDKTKLLARIRARTRKSGQPSAEQSQRRGRVDYAAMCCAWTARSSRHRRRSLSCSTASLPIRTMSIPETSFSMRSGALNTTAIPARLTYTSSACAKSSKAFPINGACGRSGASAINSPCRMNPRLRRIPRSNRC